MELQTFRAAAVALAVLGGTPTATAQDDRAADLRARLEQKLADTWIRNAAWITDLDAAKAAARERGAQIFGYFTRSYAP